MIDYSKLWILLSQYGISKTEFMNQIGASSATIAKLSSNQPVTMDILERICSCLRCSLDNIVSFSAGADMPKHWSGIDEESTYLIYFYFVQAEDEETDIKFLYGYACPFCMTPDGLENWELSCYKNFDNVFQIKGYCIGRDLLNILMQMQQNITFGQIIEKIRVNVKCYDCKDDLRDKIFLISLFQGIPQYRPAYMLESHNRNGRIISALRPQVGISDCTMRCESLVSGNTRNLYCDNAKPNLSKILFLNEFFKTIYRYASVNDMARLGNFEVLSFLNKSVNEESGIHWRIITHEKKKDGQIVADSLEIVLDHQFFSGQYAMLVRVSNTQNIFLEHLELVCCEKKDFVYNVSLQESPGTVEIRLYQPSGNSFESNLIADSSATLIRNISINMNIVERRFRIEDSWSNKMKEKGIKVDSTGEYTSNETFSIGDQESELWFQDERIVSEECGRILNTISNENSGLFFEAGDDMHLRFLDWLKQTLKNTSCKHVVIIDPYIDGDAIGKILRGITNPSITYDIYTSDEKKERIDEIKKVLASLQIVAPSSFNIYEVLGGVIHDRFLILECEDSFIPKVYALTNSLDNVGQHHSSLVIPLDNCLASKVNSYYLELIERMKNANKIEEVSSISKSETSITADTDSKEIAIVNSIDEYQSLCVNDFASALAQLAYMKPGELKDKCKKHLFNVEKIGDKIKQLLNDYLTSPTEGVQLQNHSQSQAYEVRQLLGLAQNLLKDMDLHLNIIDSAECINNYYFEYMYIHEEWSIKNAIKYLCCIKTNEAISYLTALCEEMKQEMPNMQLRKYKVAAMFVVQLVEQLHYKDDAERVSELMLASNIPFFHAIVIAKSFQKVSSYDQETINNITKVLDNLCQSLSYKEQLLAHIYCIQRLQVCYYRKKERYESIQLIIDEIINKFVSTVNSSLQESDKSYLSYDDLYKLLHVLYSRNSEDICKIYLALVQNNYITPKKAAEYLQNMLLEPFEKGLKNEEGVFYGTENLAESQMIFGYMNKIQPSSINTTFTQVKKKERDLMSILYSVTLREQNYSQWKCYMDMLCCFVYLELWAEKEYNHKVSKAIAEFIKISSNYSNMLMEYSEVYQALCNFLEH